jgi:hypothetical protein
MSFAGIFCFDFLRKQQYCFFIQSVMNNSRFAVVSFNVTAAILVHEQLNQKQAQSNRGCNIFNFAVLDFL